MEDVLKELTKTGLKDLLPEIDVKTVVGEEFLVDGTKVFPVVKVSSGYVGGGSEFCCKKKQKGVVTTNGYGSTCEPLGFFVAGKTFEFVPIKQEKSLFKVVNSIAKNLAKMLNVAEKASVKKMKEKNKNAKK